MSPMRFSVLPVLVAVISLLPALSQAQQQAPQSQQALACLIAPDEVVEVGSPVVGVLESVDVERGAMVTKGQVVARLSSSVERANRAVAMQRLKADSELQAAIVSQEFLKKRAERSESLLKQEYISAQAHDQVANESRVADRKVTAAREARSVLERELQLAEAQLAQRSIHSPVSGVVVERYLSGGERVEEKPIVKIAAVDPLRVDVVMPAAMFFTVRRGMTAQVTSDLPGLGAMAATVQSLDRVIDAASSTFRMRLSLPNPGNRVPAGLRCKISLEASTQAGTSL